MAGGKSSKRSILSLLSLIVATLLVACVGNDGSIAASQSRRRSDTGGSGACRLSSTERRAIAALGHVRSKVR